VGLALAALSPYRTALRLSGASYVARTVEPMLHAALDRLCALAIAPKPRLAVSADEVPEAFTVDVPPSGSVIVVTRGLLRRLEPQEIEAVLAHVLNRDGAVMTVASFPLFAACGSPVGHGAARPHGSPSSSSCPTRSRPSRSISCATRWRGTSPCAASSRPTAAPRS
jgi:hypothetical protein